jgi:hypothetical protein
MSDSSAKATALSPAALGVSALSMPTVSQSVATTSSWWAAARRSERHSLRA